MLIFYSFARSSLLPFVCPSIGSPHDMFSSTLPGTHNYVPNSIFLHIAELFSAGCGSFLVLSAAGHAGGPRVRTARVWAPAEARALGVQSREKWRVTTGSVSNNLEPTRPIETRKRFGFLNSRVCSTRSHHHHQHQQEKARPLSPARESTACCCCCCYLSAQQQQHNHHHSLQALRSAHLSHCTADVCHKHERRNWWFQFQNLVDASHEHAKPQLPLIIPKQPRRHSTSIQQHSNTAGDVQHAAAAVQALLPL